MADIAIFYPILYFTFTVTKRSHQIFRQHFFPHILSTYIRSFAIVFQMLTSFFIDRYISIASRR